VMLLLVGLNVNHASQYGIWVPRKSAEELDGVGRSQDLPDAN
jgi:hypothetical protein